MVNDDVVRKVSYCNCSICQGEKNMLPDKLMVAKRVSCVMVGSYPFICQDRTKNDLPEQLMMVLTDFHRVMHIITG